LTAVAQGIESAPANAIAVPGDYDNDHCTDMALKSPSGIWYIDLCENGFGGLWDGVYYGSGDSTAIPIPADYDGDGRTDLSVKDNTGMWGIDYASNGFGHFDEQHWMYGDNSGIPVPAKFDSDNRADLSIKGADGCWRIDYSADGFGAFNETKCGYGDNTPVPVPADYDGDAHADLAIRGTDGCWSIDYWGFGTWDEIRCYGLLNAIPAPADYDHDNRIDIAIKDYNGVWRIDYSTGGFGSTWNATYLNKGGSTAVPVPGDYNGDGWTDMAVKDNSTGAWSIDFYPFGSGYEMSVSTTSINRVVIDQDKPYITSTKLYTDPSIIGVSNGEVPLYANTAYVTIGRRYVVDAAVAAGTPRLVSTNKAATASSIESATYSAAKAFDASSTTRWASNYSDNEWIYVDLASEYLISSIRLNWETAYGRKYRLEVSSDLSTWTEVATEENGNGGIDDFTFPVSDSEKPLPTARYVRLLGIQRGTQWGYSLWSFDVYGIPPGAGSVRQNPMNISPNLKVVNGDNGGTYVFKKRITHRRFAMTCTAPGTYLLRFWLDGYDPDQGITVVCEASQPGLYGRVTTRTWVGGAGYPLGFLYRPGTPIGGVTVHATRFPDVDVTTTTALGNGTWSLPGVTGTVSVEFTTTCFPPNCQFSDAKAVNVTVPEGSGTNLDVSLEEYFPGYTMYIDYSRGRTLLHTLTVDTAAAGPVPTVKIAPSPYARYITDPDEMQPECKKRGFTATPEYEKLFNIASNNPQIKAIVNGMWPDNCSGAPAGYMYPQFTGPLADPAVPCFLTLPGCALWNEFFREHEMGDMGPVPLMPTNTYAMFTIAGNPQQFDVIETPADFRITSTNQWNTRPSYPDYYIWDVSPRDGVSDVTGAMQINNPPLLWQNRVPSSGILDSRGDPDWAFASTAVGYGDHQRLFIVVADSENVWGGHGATANQLGRFFRDVLHANGAMRLDSGLSTEMTLRFPSGLRRVNTLTGEDPDANLNPYTEAYPSDILGAVHSYISLEGP
jgi:hypothetical protein